MIRGVGVDIASIARIAQACAKPRFMDKVFTLREKQYYAGKAAPNIAGAWAAKEAVSKALGVSLGTIMLHEIEILHRDSGQPYVCLGGKYADLTGQVHLSISHERDNAIAMAIWEGEG